MDTYLEKIKKEDLESFYFLRCDKENILWTGHKSIPQKETFRRWFEKQLKDKKRIIFLAKLQRNPSEVVGYLYLDKDKDFKNIVETSHGVNSTYKNKGIGTQIIKCAIEYCTKNLPKITKMIGWVAENNIGSIKNFLKNNYIETGQKREVFYEGFNKYLTQKKYLYQIKR